MVWPRPIWLSLLRSNTFWWVLGVCNCSLGQHVNDPILLDYGNAQTSSNMCWLAASVLNNPQYTKVEYFENLLAAQTLEYKTSPFYLIYASLHAPEELTQSQVLRVVTKKV